MGEVPRWYRLLKAAQYLRADIRDMEDMPWRFVRQAEEASEVEEWAANQKLGQQPATPTPET